VYDLPESGNAPDGAATSGPGAGGNGGSGGGSGAGSTGGGGGSAGGSGGGAVQDAAAEVGGRGASDASDGPRQDTSIADARDAPAPDLATDSLEASIQDQMNDLSADAPSPINDASVDMRDAALDEGSTSDVDASRPTESGVPDAPSEAGPPTGVSYRLVAKHSSKCADVYHNLTADGTALDQYTCNGTSAQTFELRSVGGSYAFAGTNSGKCLAASNGGTTDGTPIVLAACNGAAAQSFTLSAAAGGSYVIVSVPSGKCIDVTSASTADGAVLQLWTCSGQDHQSWGFQ
jgi:hypothetical protein